MSSERTILPKNLTGVFLRLTDTQVYLAVIALSVGFSLGGVLLGQGPIAYGGDEFAYLLGGQTFAQGRLTNPPHPHWEFFETFHVLMQPTYMAKYPPAQCLVLAVGYKLGHPIIGVWLSAATFALATTWLIRARFSPLWALLGGIICVIQFGGTHFYSQSYEGGAVAATGGALLIGGMLRLIRFTSVSAAVFLGLGVAIGLLSRPFETVLLCIVPGIVLLHSFLWKHPRRIAFAKHFLLGAIPVVLVALLFQVRLNDAVTGDWKTLPYTTYEAQYSGAPLFVWQSERPVPSFRHSVLTAFHENYVMRLSRFYAPVSKIWLYRTYYIISDSLGLFLTIVAAAGSILYANRLVGCILLIIGTSSVGFVVSYWFSLHYYAGLQGACILLVIHAFRGALLSRRALRPHFAIVAIAVVLLCATARALGKNWQPFVGRSQAARQEVADKLSASGGGHLVFVRRIPPYNYHFIGVHNDANIDASAIVWAHDRGETENRKLIDYYGSSRRVWVFIDNYDGNQLVEFSMGR